MKQCNNATIKKGFTLIEMLVAITVFSLIVGAAVGLFISAIRSQAFALPAQKLLDETSFTIEYMGRFLRMARKDIGATCLSISGLNYENPGADPSKIRFINLDGKCHEFFKDGNFLKERRSTDNFAVNFQSPLELTSPDFEVTSLQFNLSGALQPPSDFLQPKVTIATKIKKAGVLAPEIKIQTTISQRNLDVQQ